MSQKRMAVSLAVLELQRQKWTGGHFTPRHISNSRAHSNKIPTAIPIFSGAPDLEDVCPTQIDNDYWKKTTWRLYTGNRNNF